MIDNFSEIDTEGGDYGFCHRRHAVMILFFFFKGQVKSPILHNNTRDGSEFMFLTFRTICNFRGRTWALGRVEGGRGGIPGLHTCLL